LAKNDAEQETNLRPAVDCIPAGEGYTIEEVSGAKRT